MKKLSVGLFSLLAIVLAVTSAFTTKPATPKFANDFEVWSIVNNALSATQTDYTTVDAQKLTKLYDGAGTQPVGATNADKLAQAITDYNSSHNPDFSCSIDISHMCVAYLNRGSGSTAVLATDDGDANF